MYCYSRNKYKKSVLSVLEHPETLPRARAFLAIPEGIGNPLGSPRKMATLPADFH